MNWRTGRKGFKVTREAAMQLPDYGHAYCYAKRIGASKQTVLNWIYRAGLLAYKQPDGTFIIERQDFLKFCYRTGRYDGPVP